MVDRESPKRSWTSFLGISALPDSTWPRAVLRPETYRVQSLSVPLLALAVTAFLAKWLSPVARIVLLCRAQKIPLSFRPRCSLT